MTETVSTVETELEWAAKRVFQMGWEEHGTDPDARRHYRKAARTLLNASGRSWPEAAAEVSRWDDAAEASWLKERGVRP